MPLDFKDEPSVSVVIPAYKARNYLKESLSSVATQDYPNLEVLVIDDCSPEPIDDILAEYAENSSAPSHRLLRHEKNQGLGASRNTGIKNARGEYIALLDHDDVWKPDHVSNLMRHLLQDKADLAFCSVIQFESDPETSLGLWGPPNNELEEDFVFSLFKMSFITPSATLIRRTSLLHSKGFSTEPSVHMCEDLDLWLRLIQSGAKISFSKSPTAYYRKHPAAATSRPGYMAYQSAYVKQIHMQNIVAPWFQKRSIVARNWWGAFNTLAITDRIRPDVLLKAIQTSLPVPWEAIRGLVHLFRGWQKKF
jgi:glycosyltransferase involved in cell wall biosynthesis